MGSRRDHHRQVRARFFHILTWIIISEKRLRDEPRPFCFVSRLSLVRCNVNIDIDMLLSSFAFKNVLQRIVFLHPMFFISFSYNLSIVLSYI